MRVKLFLLLLFIPSLLFANEPYKGDTTGLVGWWKLDEASGLLIDSSSVSVNGTSSGSPMYNQPGVINRAMKFDGVDDWITFNNNDNHNARTHDLSVSFWIRAGVAISTDGYDGIIWKNSGATGGNNYWFIRRNSGAASIGVSLCNSAAQSTSSTSVKQVLDGKLHYITVIFDRDVGIKIYIDGVLDKETPAGAGFDLDQAGTTGLRIGKQVIAVPGEYGFLKGYLDDVRIYNRTLSATEILTQYQSGLQVHGDTGHGGEPAPWKNDANLTSYWKLDEASGTLVDIKGNNNGTSSGSPGYGVRGKFGRAMRFHGVNDYVALGTTGIPGGNSQRTYSLWFNTNAFPTDTSDVIFSQDPNVEAAGNQLIICPEDSAVSVGFSSHRLITPKSTLSIGTWYHVAVVIPVGATLTSQTLVYINGVNQSLTLESGSAQTLNTGTNYLTMGTERSSGVISAYNLNGFLDEVRIYDKALNATEIQTLYDYGR